MSKKWSYTQLSHKVSAKATNTFWDICMEYVPQLKEMWEREGHTKKVPGFIHQRRQLYKQYCPEVIMEFGFKNKTDGSVKKVTSGKTPLKEYQNNPDYVKLYEIASVKVIEIYENYPKKL